MCVGIMESFVKYSSPQEWLRSAALEFWLKRGTDWEKGGFFESFSLKGENLLQPRRALVQARQIYSLRVAMDLKWGDREAMRRAVERGAEFLVGKFSLPSGAFFYSLKEDGQASDPGAPLYTQAFALFGLANAFAVTRDMSLKARAKKLVQYLESERRLEEGGYSELQGGKILYEANPHMHLFEAAIAWMETDGDPAWARLAAEVLDLCLSRFIDRKSGLLGEHFGPGWDRKLEGGRYVAEPGHLFEWAWLLGRYEKLQPSRLGPVQARLFELAEGHGVCPRRGVVFDEIWSDLAVKTKTSRTWPQCERIKCAAALHARAAAESAMTALMKYVATEVPGLWYDRMEDGGELRPEPAKASTLYHIVGAVAEYSRIETIETKR
jgi:mannose/cellobiose epimerase-like protein (N-acyl-D-glucosamine 2-epimerase family)